MGEMKDITREGEIRRTKKKVVGCVQDLVGEKRLSVQFFMGRRKR